jgi:hypothetical protein
MSNNPQEQPEVLIACNPGAIDPAHRDSHVAVAQSIFNREVILEIKELPNGYAFRLPLETPMLYKTVEWIANERLCCPFFTFTLVVGDQLWLELTGTPEVRQIIQADVLQIIETDSFPTLGELEASYAAVAGDQR